MRRVFCVDAELVSARVITPVCVCSLLISPRTPLGYSSWLKYVSVCLSLLYTFLFDCMPRIPLPLYRCTEPASAVGHIWRHVRFFGRLRWCFSWLRLSFNHTHTSTHANGPSSLLSPASLYPSLLNGG